MKLASRSRSAMLTALFAAATAPAALGGTSYVTDLVDFNDTGVEGTVTAILDDAAERLYIEAQISGLTPDVAHPTHIHGRVDDGEPLDSRVPSLLDDVDGDGFVELAEGVPSYGPVLLPVVDDNGDFFSADSSGVLSFEQTFDLTDAGVFADDFDIEQLLPLDLREFVVHGAVVPPAIGAGTAGEVNGSGGYTPTLPVGAGGFDFTGTADFPGDAQGGGTGTAVPAPSAAVGGLALLGLAAGRRGVRR